MLNADLVNLFGEGTAAQVMPKQENEFTCARCFLVQHRSRLATAGTKRTVCKDCA